MSERFQASGKKIYRIKRGALTIFNKATGKTEKITSRETEQKLNKEIEPEIQL
jgi:VIT1/CCC1 family predicted Fe2+/Mn2+ transporter